MHNLVRSTRERMTIRRSSAFLTCLGCVKNYLKYCIPRVQLAFILCGPIRDAVRGWDSVNAVADSARSLLRATATYRISVSPRPLGTVTCTSFYSESLRNHFLRLWRRHGSLKLWRSVLSLKNTAVWDVTPCSQVEAHRQFGRTYCLHLVSCLAYSSVLKMTTVRSSETSANLLYRTTRRYIPEDCTLRRYRCENLQSIVGFLGMTPRSLVGAYCSFQLSILTRP
jgi:hypothetical protein